MKTRCTSYTLKIHFFPVPTHLSVVQTFYIIYIPSAQTFYTICKADDLMCLHILYIITSAHTFYTFIPLTFLLLYYHPGAWCWCLSFIWTCDTCSGKIKANTVDILPQANHLKRELDGDSVPQQFPALICSIKRTLKKRCKFPWYNLCVGYPYH